MWRFLAALFLTLTFAFPAQADPTDLESRDWSTTSSRPLDKFQPSYVDIKQLVNNVVDASWTLDLCSYQFIDVYEGDFRLAASLDTNGRHACNEVIVIEKSKPTFRAVNKLQVVGADNVNDMLSDVDGDRSPELVVSEPWSRKETGHCLATWQHIYKWQRGRFSDTSASFPKIYKTRQKELQSLIARDADPTCHQMEIDRIARFLGTPKAGFDRALHWMKSPDASLRRKASTVFGNICDGPSLDKLATLSKDVDSLVSESAREDKAACSATADRR